MKKATPPRVSTLATGIKLIAKEMQAKAGDLLLEHSANQESIVFVHEGECSIAINGDHEHLKRGDAFIVPANVKHQISVIADFKGIHFMPLEIKFEFFN